MLQARMEEAVREYDRQGWHRTGSDGSRRCVLWLTDRVRDLGLTPELRAERFDRVVPRNAYVEIDGRRIEGLPLFDCTHTGPEGLEGHIGPPGSDAPIWLVEQVCWGAPGYSRTGHGTGETRREAAAKGVVLVTLGPRPGLSANNRFARATIGLVLELAAS